MVCTMDRSFLYLNLTTGYQVLHKRLKLTYADANQAAYLIDHDARLTDKWRSQTPLFLNYYEDFKSGAFAQFLTHYANRPDTGSA